MKFMTEAATFPEFTQAEELFNRCAHDNLFFSPWCHDCDSCPVKTQCLNFWDRYVVLEPREKDQYLSVVTETLRQFQAKKKEGNKRKEAKDETV